MFIDNWFPPRGLVQLKNLILYFLASILSLLLTLVFQNLWNTFFKRRKMIIFSKFYLSTSIIKGSIAYNSSDILFKRKYFSFRQIAIIYCRKKNLSVSLLVVKEWSVLATHFSQISEICYKKGQSIDQLVHIFENCSRTSNGFKKR